MITELCPACWLYHAPGANCKEANALGQAWLVKPPVDDPRPEESGVVVVAESQAPEPSEPGDGGLAPIRDNAVPAHSRAKRKYTRKPK